MSSSKRCIVCGQSLSSNEIFDGKDKCIFCEQVKNKEEAEEIKRHHDHEKDWE